MTKALIPLRFSPAAEGAFHRALQQEAYAYLYDRNDHRFADRPARIKALLILLASIACYALALQASDAVWFIACYASFAVLMMWLNIDVNHDASHLTFTRRRFWNAFISRAVTLSTGIEPVYWRTRHVSYHHATRILNTTIWIPKRTGFFARRRFSAGASGCTFSISTGRWWQRYP